MQQLSYSIYPRYPELDALRGIAILLMVAFHLLFDLAYFWHWNLDVQSGWLLLMSRSTASLFLLISGICFSISWDRTQPERRLRKALRRTAILLLAAALVTAVTAVLFPEAVIVFGILHLLGVSALIEPLLLRLRGWNMLIGIVLIALPLLLPPSCEGCHPLLLPLGVHSGSFSSLDYYPLLPWMGAVCIGMAVGNALYLPGRAQALSPLGNIRYPMALLWAGKHSLPIYFVHQPVLLSLLFLGANVGALF